MEQYIDKFAVVAEIEKRITNIKEYCVREGHDRRFDVVPEQLSHILSFLDTLEVKEEVLDENDKTKLMRKCVKVAYKRGYDMGVLQTTNKINSNIKEVNIAEMADEYYDALMKETGWMDEGTMGHCRLAYYTGCKDVLNKLRKGE